MQCLVVSVAVRLIYRSLGVKGLIITTAIFPIRDQPRGLVVRVSDY